MYRITLFRRQDGTDAPITSVVVYDLLEVRGAAYHIALEHGLPTSRVARSQMMLPGNLSKVLAIFGKTVIGLTEPENPTAPDNLIRDGILVEEVKE